MRGSGAQRPPITEVNRSTLDKKLHKIIARHDGLHGITHNIMGGKMLSEEHCRNCRETSNSIQEAITLFIKEEIIGSDEPEYNKLNPVVGCIARNDFRAAQRKRLEEL